jgi:hypothetical protein
MRGITVASERTKYVCTVTVFDPDTNLPVEVEIRKCVKSGALVGLDGSFLEQEPDVVRNPYNKGNLNIPDEVRAVRCVPTQLILTSNLGEVHGAVTVPFDLVTNNEAMEYLRGVAEEYNQRIMEEQPESPTAGDKHAVACWIREKNGDE